MTRIPMGRAENLAQQQRIVKRISEAPVLAYIAGRTSAEGSCGYGLPLGVAGSRQVPKN